MKQQIKNYISYAFKSILNFEFLLSTLSSFLIGASHIVNIYLNNLGEIYFEEVQTLLFEYLFVIFISTLVVAIFLRKMIIYVPLAWLLLFLWQTIGDFIYLQTSFEILAGELALVIIAVIFSFLIWQLWKVNRKDILKFSFGFSVILFFSPIVSDFPSFKDAFDQNSNRIIDLRREAIKIEHLSNKVRTSDLPDIIYLVPDRYASADTLLKEYRWDNSEFYSALKERGFKVNQNSISNYPVTYQSLSSNLNATYLDKFSRFTKDYPSDRKPLFALTEENWVQESLRNIGYYYFHLGFYWTRTKTNKFADRNYTTEIEKKENQFLITNISPLGLVLFNKTPFVAVSKRLFKYDPNILMSCKFMRSKIDELKNVKIDRTDHPTFIFAHLSMPHEPIFFNEHGDCLEPLLNTSSHFNRERFSEDVFWEKFKSDYLSFLKFTNNTLLDIFDAHSKPKNRDLIFVIQSDEGPHPHSWRKVGGIPDNTLEVMNLDDWKIKSGIINAMLTTNSNQIKSDDLKTPINNWIYIFNHILDTNIEPLPHEVYGILGENNLYNFLDLNHMIDSKHEIND